MCDDRVVCRNLGREPSWTGRQQRQWHLALYSAKVNQPLPNKIIFCHDKFVFFLRGVRTFSLCRV